MVWVASRHPRRSGVMLNPPCNGSSEIRSSVGMMPGFLSTLGGKSNSAREGDQGGGRPLP